MVQLLQGQRLSTITTARRLGELEKMPLQDLENYTRAEMRRERGLRSIVR